jgi:hypothetical protein
MMYRWGANSDLRKARCSFCRESGEYREVLFGLQFELRVFDANGVREVENGSSGFYIGNVEVLGLVSAAMRSRSNTNGREEYFRRRIRAISEV